MSLNGSAERDTSMKLLPPVGSAAGNISPPQIDHAATAVTMPANPGRCEKDDDRILERGPTEEGTLR